MSNYKNKYEKYKRKYILLKNQLSKQSGSSIIECNNDIFLNNTYGTCWNVAIQMVFIFGDKTRDIVQNNIFHEEISVLIDNMLFDENLFKVLPINFFNNNIYTNGLKSDIVLKINTFLLNFKNRTNIKKKEYYEHTTSRKITLYRNESKICERDFTNNFFSLFSEDKNESNGGSYIGYDQFFLILLLAILLYKQKIHYDSIYVDTKIVELLDINKLNSSIGIMIHYRGHMCCLYKCSGKHKYYNDNFKKIYNYNWILLFVTINELIEKNDQYVIYSRKNELVDISYLTPGIINTPFIINKTTNELIYIIENQKFVEPLVLNYDAILTKLNNTTEFYKLLNIIILNDDMSSDIQNYKIDYLDYYLHYYIYNDKIEYISYFLNDLYQRELSKPEIKYYIKRYISEIDAKGHTILDTLVEQKKYHTVKKLIPIIQNPDIKNNYGETILQLLLKKKFESPEDIKNQEDMIEFLIDNNANIDGLHEIGYFLKNVIEKKLYSLSNKIIDKIKFIDNITNDLVLPVILETEQYILAEKIIDKSVDFNNSSSKKNSLIISLEKKQFELSKKILEKTTVIHNAVSEKEPIGYTLENGEYDLAKIIIQKSINVNIPSNNKTPLMIAIEKERYDIAELIVFNRSFNTNNFKWTEKSPLITLLENNNFYLGYIIADKTNSPNIDVIYNNKNALILSLEKEQYHISRLIIKKSKNLNYISNGKTALMIALEKKQLILANEIRERLINTDLYELIETETDEKIYKYIEDCTNIKLQYIIDDITILHLLIEKNKCDLADKILDKIICVDLPAFADSMSILELAISKAKYDLAEKIVDKSCIIDHTYNDTTPLLTTIQRRKFNLAKKIAKRTINYYYMDYNGHTALDIAREKNITELIPILESKKL